LQTAFSKGEFNSGITDTTSVVVINQQTVVKPYALVQLELGYRRITEKNKIHQFSIQLFYGLQKQSDGYAAHYNSSAAPFAYQSKGHFAALQYTFWFGKNAQ